jgi:hypothetical protein
MDNNPFDQFLNHKLSEEEFTFDAENWAKAEKLINQKDRKRRQIGRWFSATLGAIILPFLAFTLKSDTEHQHSLKNTKQEIRTSNSKSMDKVMRLVVNMNQPQDYIKRIHANDRKTNNPSVISPLQKSLVHSFSQQENKGHDESDLSRAQKLINEATEENAESNQMRNVNPIMPLQNSIDKQKESESKHLSQSSENSRNNKQIGIYLGSSLNIGVAKAATLSAIYGISFHRQLTSQWAFTIQAGYFSSGKINYERCNEVTTYSLGMNTIEDSISTSKLHYLTIPISLSYTVHPKHLISVGASPTFLCDSRNKVKHEEIVNGESVLKKEYKDHGLSNGISPFDLQITLGYTYLLTKKLSVGINIYNGLIKTTDKSIYMNPLYSNKQNRGITFQVNYRFIDYK